jgi:hypothetical protein
MAPVDRIFLLTLAREKQRRSSENSNKTLDNPVKPKWHFCKDGIPKKNHKQTNPHGYTFISLESQLTQHNEIAK